MESRRLLNGENINITNNTWYSGNHWLCVKLLINFTFRVNDLSVFFIEKLKQAMTLKPSPSPIGCSENKSKLGLASKAVAHKFGILVNVGHK